MRLFLYIFNFEHHTCSGRKKYAVSGSLRILLSPSSVRQYMVEAERRFACTSLKYVHITTMKLKGS